MKTKHNGIALAWLTTTLLLTACGGGGSGTSNNGTSNNVSPTALPGELDASFGSGGIARTGMGIGPRAMTILPDGEIEVPGTAWLGSNVEYMLNRYKADGSIDNSFGNGGKLTFQPSGQGFYATGMAHQQDGILDTFAYIRSKITFPPYGSARLYKIPGSVALARLNRGFDYAGGL